MADNELTHEEVLALAGAFPVAAARTLLSAARFPAWAIPETGFANSYEFWIKVSEQLAAGVMPDGRRRVITAARRVYPFSDTLPEVPPAAATGSAAVPAGSPGRPAVSVTDSRGFQVGDGNIQINIGPEYPRRAAEGSRGDQAPPGPRPAQATPRVLVIGASPIDEDLPHVRADREAHAIEKVALPDRIAVKVVLGAEATDVRHVGSFRPDIVHFICHGTGDSLVFSDTQGEADFVAASRVAERLRFYRDEQGVRLRGVVLAACDGERLAPAFAGVADTVIAHRGKLADQCGVAFAEQFYTRLAGVPGPWPATPAVDLAAIAHEAAQLTAQCSAACEPVIARLILLPAGG